jgi:tetratricopeptide (TPR) repeat protein
MAAEASTLQLQAMTELFLEVEWTTRAENEEAALKESASALADLGRGLFQLGKTTEAEKVFSLAIDRLVDCRLAAVQDLQRRLFSNRGRCRYALQRPREAIQDFAASWVRAAPNDRAVLQTLAHTALDDVLRSVLGVSSDNEVLPSVKNADLKKVSEQLQRVRLLSGVFQTTNLLDDASQEVERRFPRGNRPASDKFTSKGDKLANGAQTTDWGPPMSKRECYERALSMDPRNTKAWHSLANFMYFHMSQTETVNVNGEALTRHMCCMKALELDARISHAWSNLGVSLVKSGEEVVVVGEPYTQRRCLEQALELDPRNWHAWYTLALSPPDRSGSKYIVTVNGENFMWRSCCEKALEIDEKNAYVWCNLALSLDKEKEAKAMVHGAWVSRQQCFVNALTLDGKFGKVWLHLALSMPPSAEVTISGEAYSVKKCFEQAVTYDSNQSATWFHLGCCLKEKESANIRGELFSKIQCFEKVLEIDPHDPDAWFNLGVLLAPGELACKGLYRQQCFALSLSVDQTNPEAWSLLAASLNEGDEMTVAGEKVGRKQCLERAVAWLDPSKKK